MLPSCIFYKISHKCVITRITILLLNNFGCLLFSDLNIILLEAYFVDAYAHIISLNHPLCAGFDPAKEHKLRRPQKSVKHITSILSPYYNNLKKSNVFTYFTTTKSEILK